jgi:hypothetical protein
MLDPLSVLVAALGMFLIAFMQGAFGGGFAIIGIPLLSLVMDPITAGAVLAPLFVIMSLFALRYWKPQTWSKPDLAVLVPALIVGIAAGYLLLRVLDQRLVAILMALITLAFVVLWLLRGGRVQQQQRSVVKATVAGLAAGITSMVAHSGGPPLAMYLLPLGLSKQLYAGTTSMFFLVGNIVKAGPWLMLAQPTREMWLLMGLCLPFVPLGVWAGYRLHERLDQQQLYRACYGLLIITALKLLWDGVSGFL